MGIFKSFGKKVVSAIKTVGSAVKTVGESIGMTVYEWVKDPDAISNDITVNNIDILERFIFDPVDEGNIIELKENAHVRLDITREVKKLSKEPKNATLDIYFSTRIRKLPPVHRGLLRRQKGQVRIYLAGVRTGGRLFFAGLPQVRKRGPV